MEKKVKKNQKAKNWFFEMSNKINISLETQFKKRERAQKHYTGNNWDITQGTADQKEIMRKTHF